MFKLLIALSLIISPYWIQAKEFIPSFAIGIVTSEGARLLISTTKDSLRDDIVLICSPIKRICKPILSESLTVVGVNESVEDVETNKSVYTYSFLDDISSNDIDIAVIYPKLNAREINVTFGDKEGVFITANAFKIRISFCTSTEGVHVYSEPKKYHLYYALGYEVMANCSEEVYE